ncbi:hypothetical protein B0T17DRAFT_509811 [Bombardia bombarda]|uniref:Uncharacterized protein n=1 Tax=Bombardia bombarda TaxID=252184 RepID=A0AA40BY81_9PEZI|nr:hypothetical protein B0T17DRAFT_509811 [Bombardia bombarda]
MSEEGLGSESVDDVGHPLFVQMPGQQLPLTVGANLDLITQRPRLAFNNRQVTWVTKDRSQSRQTPSGPVYGGVSQACPLVNLSVLSNKDGGFTKHDISLAFREASRRHSEQPRGPTWGTAAAWHPALRVIVIITTSTFHHVFPHATIEEKKEMRAGLSQQVNPSVSAPD